MSTKESNPTKYRMYFNYNNDKDVYVIPMLPEKIKAQAKGKTISIDIDKFGEYVEKGKRDAMIISFSSYFPALYARSYCSCLKKEFKSPEKWHKWMLALEGKKLPFHFVLEGSPLAINMYAIITSYSAEEAGGDVETISYSIELKEFRKPSLSTYKKKKKKKAKKSKGGKRTNNKAKTKKYIVKKGDNLWNLAKKFYKDGKKQTKIYNANKSVIEKAAKKHGKSSSGRGKWIYPGTKLTIP